MGGRDDEPHRCKIALGLAIVCLAWRLAPRVALTTTTGLLHRRSDPEPPAAGQSRRIAGRIDHRLDLQRARRPQHLRRRRAGLHAAPSHAVHRRRWAGADAAVVFERRQDDRLRARRRSRLEPARRPAQPVRQYDATEDPGLGRPRRRRDAEAARRRRRAGDRARRHARRVRARPPDLARADRRVEAEAEAPRSSRAARASRPSWSPDGRTLAFVSNRGDHSFIGLFTPNQPIRFLAPSTSRDSSPTWSMDGKKIAFLRQPGAGGAPRSPLTEPESTWAIVVAEMPIRQPANARRRKWSRP